MTGAEGFGPPIYYIGAAYGLAALVIGVAIVASLWELAAWARRVRALDAERAAKPAAKPAEEASWPSASS